MPRIATLSVFLFLVVLKRVRRDIRDSRNGGHCQIVFVDSQRLIAWSQNWTKCVKYVWLSYPTWPSRWVLCISMQWLRLKGCHVTCDEWTSGEICSLQHMWVTGTVMWAAASDESLKFGVQGATATNWFPRVNGARDIGFDCNQHLDLVNPRVADLRDVCQRAWTSLHDIDHGIWPWSWPWIKSSI